MHVGLGTTLLQKSNGELDGIGVYTQALLSHLKNHAELSLNEIAFDHFRRDVLTSALTGLPFSGSRRLTSKMDLFHAPDHYIPKLLGVPVIATLMDPIPLMRPDWANSQGRKLKNYFFRRSAHWASHYITISQSVVPDLVEHFGIKEENITPIHLGVDVNDFAPISSEDKTAVLKKLGLPPSVQSNESNGCFLFVGTLQPRKNVDRILQAFSLLPLEMQKTHPLVIVGREGWSSEHTVEKLKKLIRSGVAYWLGYVSFLDKVALLQIASALVFPSLYEGFGLPVLEAFASHLPVITSNVSSLPEVAGDAAYFVDPLDIEALSEAMKQVVIAPEAFKPLIEKGYVRATQMTWARCAEKTLDVYKLLYKKIS